jgi:hypothetical protein
MPWNSPQTALYVWSFRCFFCFSFVPFVHRWSEESFIASCLCHDAKDAIENFDLSSNVGWVLSKKTRHAGIEFVVRLSEMRNWWTSSSTAGLIEARNTQVLSVFYSKWQYYNNLSFSAVPSQHGYAYRLALCHCVLRSAGTTAQKTHLGTAKLSVN